LPATVDALRRLTASSSTVMASVLARNRAASLPVPSHGDAAGCWHVIGY
jgi:hypothetical protein